MSKASNLLLAYDNLDWESYIQISDAIIKINKDDLYKELQDQASLYSYYNGLKSYCKKNLEKEQLKLEQLVSIKKKEESEVRNAQGQRVTDKLLESLVLSSEEYTNQKNNVINLTYKYNLLSGLVSALEAKANMVVQLSANARAETQLYKNS